MFALQQGDMDNYMGDFLTYGFQNRDKSSSVDIVLKEMEDLQLHDKELVYNYDNVYASPWAPHIDFEKRHRIITEVKTFALFVYLNNPINKISNLNS